jgi:hypothetical protein
MKTHKNLSKQDPLEDKTGRFLLKVLNPHPATRQALTAFPPDLLLLVEDGRLCVRFRIMHCTQVPGWGANVG